MYEKQKNSNLRHYEKMRDELIDDMDNIDEKDQDEDIEDEE